MVDPKDLISYAGISKRTGVPQSTLRAWKTRDRIKTKPIRDDVCPAPIWLASEVLPEIERLRDDG
jgi:hypothetical protein